MDEQVTGNAGTTSVGPPGKRGGQRRLWLHFGLLLVVSILFFLAWGLWAPTGPEPWGDFGQRLRDSVRALPGTLFPLLPILAGVGVGLSRVRIGLTRHAAMLVVVTTLGMLAIDLWAPLDARPSLLQPAWVAETLEVVPQGDPLRHGRAVSALAVLVQRGEERQEEVLLKYPPGHPRLVLTQGLVAALLMGFPLGLVGVVLGANAWVQDRASFRRPKDERVATVILAWVIVPTSYWVVFSISLDAQVSVLFQGEPPILILVPVLPLILAGMLGWRAARRLERETAWTDVITADDTP